MAYSPAFQFYPKDYLGDKNTIPMTTLEHGAYDLLWMHCWNDDGLPDDLEELAGMAKMSVDTFTPIWNARIKRCFKWDERKKKYFHPRLLKEIKKQKSWKKEKSERGKRAAVSRWNKKAKADADAMHVHTDAMYTNASSSSSSFSSSSSKNRDGLDQSLYISHTISDVKKELGIEKFNHTQEREWTNEISLAFINHVPRAEFVECFSLLRQQRGYAIKPSWVTDNLPDIEKLRKKQPKAAAKPNRPTGRELAALADQQEREALGL